jgi:hypothetical protein
MHRLAVPAALLLLIGCATGSGMTSAPPAGPPPRVDAVGNGYDVRLSNDGQAAVTRLEATPEAAWTALMAAYGKLEIPLTTVDAGSRTAGNPGFSVRRRLGGQALSRYLDCGTNLNGVIANSYIVQLSVSSKLTPDAQRGTTLETRVTASATSPQGTGSGPVRCTSTGRLEADIAKLAQIAAA